MAYYFNDLTIKFISCKDELNARSSHRIRQKIPSFFSFFPPHRNSQRILLILRIHHEKVWRIVIFMCSVYIVRAPNSHDGTLSCIIIMLYKCGIAIYFHSFYTFLSLDDSNNSVLNSVNKFSSMSTSFITLIIRTDYKKL